LRERACPQQGTAEHALQSPARDVVAPLLASGELVETGTGALGLTGRPLRLLQACDATFAAWAAELGAQPWRFPALVMRADLDRAGFFEAFPHLATSVQPHAPAAEDTPPAHFLSSAVCFHMYPVLAGRSLDQGRLTLLSAAGECYRYEGHKMQPLIRQWAFTMREIVFLGGAEQVATMRDELMARTVRYAGILGLQAELRPASDPFFTPEARGRALLQRLKGLKQELCVPGERGDVAIASFNLHDDFFARRFDLRLADGRRAHSGCVAFGLERWVYALMSQHGLDVSL
jgi:seryl-tRNA synthetase